MDCVPNSLPCGPQHKPTSSGIRFEYADRETKGLAGSGWRRHRGPAKNSKPQPQTLLNPPPFGTLDSEESLSPSRKILYFASRYVPLTMVKGLQYMPGVEGGITRSTIFLSDIGKTSRSRFCRTRLPCDIYLCGFRVRRGSWWDNYFN